MINNLQLDKLINHIQNSQSKNIVLQVPAELVCQAIQLQSQLRKAVNSNIYLLYDCNKKSCCVDIVGAKHVNYGLLVHFGEACFSEQPNKQHYYVLPEHREEDLTTKIKQAIEKYKPDAIMLSQPLYYLAEEFKNTSVLKLPVGHLEGFEHFVFGYMKPKDSQIKSVLAVGCSEGLMEKLFLTKSALGIQHIYTLQGQQTLNSTKNLMKRLGIISKLKEVDRFGILVSNPSTSFCQSSLNTCITLLNRMNKSSYVFMMNNINETKLANFPEIEAYIIISCHNYSLYNLNDFHMLVATPFDLQYAFSEDNSMVTNYDFDCRRLKGETPQVSQVQSDKPEVDTLEKIKNHEVDIRRIFQTLSHYEGRNFKGMEFTEKKEASQMKKGKVGLAESYRPLQ